MRKSNRVWAIGLAVMLTAFAFAATGLKAQEDSQEKQTMTLQDVKDRLKENKNYLKEAKKRGKAGDAAGVETALENYDRSMEGINRAMNSGGFEGTASQREDAFNRVEKATRKHGEVLADLESKVPEQARPAIQRAMDVSQKGRTTAMSNLEQVRSERQQHERAEMQRQQQMGGFGRDSGMGRSGSVGMGGPASGAGPGAGMGRSTGASASAGRGRH